MLLIPKVSILSEQILYSNDIEQQKEDEEIGFHPTVAMGKVQDKLDV